jgi:uncharacterized protein (TIGR02231 family)
MVTVRVGDIAPVISDRSLSVAVRNANAKVIDMRVRRRMRPLEERDLRDPEGLQQTLRSLETEHSALVHRQSRLKGQLKLVDEMSRQALDDLATDIAWGTVELDRWTEALDGLGDREGALRDGAVSAATELEDVEERLQDLRRRIAAGERPDQVIEAQIEVDLEVTAGETALLELGYVVPAACWRPQYRATLLAADDDQPLRLAFESAACVWQNTGESWGDAQLCFSTQRPSLGTEPPLLGEDVLETMPKPEEVVVQARDEEIQTTGLGVSARIADQLPGIDDGGVPQLLTAMESATIPSDGRPYRIRVSSFECAAELEQVLTSELVEAVISRVTATNQGSHPILAGPVDLIADCGPVGRTTVLYIAPGERFSLGFGPNPSLRVRRKVEAVEHKPGVLSRHLTTVHTVKLLLSNVATEPEVFGVTERIPVSEVEQVRVRFEAEESTPGARPDDDGFVRWKVNLPPGGTKTITMCYRVEKRKDVTGI